MISIVIWIIASRSTSNSNISTTKLAVECSKNNVYFYKNSNEDYTEFVLTQYNLNTGEEKELQTTDVLVGINIYDDNIYYFNKEDHNLHILNPKNLKSKMVYDIQNALPNNNYVKLGSGLAYLDAGVLNIKEGSKEYQIETVWDFNVYQNQIYYIDVNTDGNNEWSIKKLNNKKTHESETILTLASIKSTFEDLYKEYGRIDKISVYDGKIYFLSGEYYLTNSVLFCYDLERKELSKITEQYVREYQITDDAIYCCHSDDTLKKYTNQKDNAELLLEDIYSFKVNNNTLMYMKNNDNTLYIENDNHSIRISNVLS